MAKVFTFGLSSASIAECARKLEFYSKHTIDRKVEQLVGRMLKEGETYAINAVGHFDTGETMSSVVAYREGSHGIIAVGGNAIWIEFGTGVEYNGGGYNHPKAAELGMSAHGTYGKGLGADPNGWVYRDDDGNYHHTKGIPTNPFMYNTAQMLRNECRNWAKEIFSK